MRSRDSSQQVDFEEIDLASNDAARDMLIEKNGHIGAPSYRSGTSLSSGMIRKKWRAC
jgi:glutaredoxin